MFLFAAVPLVLVACGSPSSSGPVSTGSGIQSCGTSKASGNYYGAYSLSNDGDVPARIISVELAEPYNMRLKGAWLMDDEAAVLVNSEAADLSAWPSRERAVGAELAPRESRQLVIRAAPVNPDGRSGFAGVFYSYELDGRSYEGVSDRRVDDYPPGGKPRSRCR